MENDNFGAIDIGSNAARLLIKNVTEDTAGNYEFSKVMFLRMPLRLGREVFTQGEISPAKERMMMCMIKGYKQMMKFYDVSCYRACATSAMRDAHNGPKVLKRIYKETGIDIEIIDGREEARLLYNNGVETACGSQGNFAYVDVGGGSTEVTMISDGQMVGSFSYNVGTVRMLSGAVEEGTMERLRGDMVAYARDYGNIEIIGSGGNINKLSRLWHEGKPKNGRGILPVEGLREIHSRLKDMTYRERIDFYSLKPDRADVIVPAGDIFLTVADALSCANIRVPNISLADSIIDGLYKKSRGCRQ